MTSKERVLCSINHSEPDRVPLWYGASEGLTKRMCTATGVRDTEYLLKKLHIDFRRVRQQYIDPELSTFDDGRIQVGILHIYPLELFYEEDE